MPAFAWRAHYLAAVDGSFLLFIFSLGCCWYTLTEARVSEGRNRNWSGWAPFDTVGVICVFVIITIKTTDQVREGLGVQCEEDCPKNWTLWNPKLKGAGRGKTLSAVCESMELPAVLSLKMEEVRKELCVQRILLTGWSSVSHASSVCVE